MRFRPLVSLLTSLVVLACGGGGAEGGREYSAAEGRAAGRGAGAGGNAGSLEIPTGRLPEGVTPLGYSLWLEVVPSRDRFRGRADIRVRVDRPTQRIWMHGHSLNVTAIEVLPDGAEAIGGTFAQHDDQGVASLALSEPLPPGEATLSLTYDAPFDRQLKGLYRVDTGGESYAFTQFEATSARYAFPCFDEPRFKVPFEVTLSVDPAHQAIANTTPAEERTVGRMKQVRFAPTEPLPTYLVAIAVGPLDVVEHAPIPPNAVRDRPLPFRGVAARGKGARLAYALEHTAALVAALETYFGTPYPYDKLDVIAVPDFASGAMENAGAITFREQLLLLDAERAPEDQRRSFAYVMAHELAHQWFGNLVTMPWWDDIWLNEAFATWMGMKIAGSVHPEYNAPVTMLAQVHEAMRSDSLVSARQIRQPIDSNHDIRNAFDNITYRKGGGVLGMFERWLGEDTFRDGIREYMARHRFGTATSDDLLDALSRVAGIDVGTPFRTFLLQPGVPLVHAERTCGDHGNGLRIRQARYFPVGSNGERAQEWQIPVCIRYGRGRDARETCALATEAESTITFEGPGCPDWVMPNANGAGYFRFTLPGEDLDRLMRAGWSRLDDRERLSVADNLTAAFESDALDAPQVFATFDRLASDGSRAIATSPMRLVEWADDYVATDAERPAVQAWAERLYAARGRRLGWTPRRNEDGETGLLRRQALSFLANVARTESIRREAAERGRRFVGFGGDGELHPEAVHADLVGLALRMAVEESDAAFFDHLLERVLASDDALFRGQGLAALGATRDRALAERVLALSLDPRLRVNEVTEAVAVQLGTRETREAAWEWFTAHFDEFAGRLATTRAGFAPWLAARFCSEDDARRVEAFFGPRIESLPGGPRNLRGALEAIRLCAALREAQGPATLQYLQAAPSRVGRSARNGASG